MADFSGYLAADELYDGPFCVLSIVDHRTFKRLFYQVLDHDPEQADMMAFFQRFQAVVHVRQLGVRGITTDGSPLYPVSIQAVLGAVSHLAHPDGGYIWHTRAKGTWCRGIPRWDVRLLPSHLGT